jgi:CubicO group peptidase (beta-lactamase class C family)
MVMRKRRKFLLILFSSVLLLFLAAFAFIYFRVENSVTWKAPPSLFKNRDTISRIDGTSIATDSLTAYINSLITKVKVHGLAVSIINNSELVYQNYFGFKNAKKSEPLNPGAVFYGASLSKTLFADVVMQLV